MYALFEAHLAYFQFGGTVNKGAVTSQIIFEKSGLWPSRATRQAEKLNI